jgi:hypothetical protein
MAAAKKATPAVATKVAVPKFGEVGYKFLLPAVITEASDDRSEYGVVIEVQVGDFDDYASMGDKMEFSYNTKEELSDLLTEVNPAYAKALKQEELKKAQADVARLTKELAAIK